MAGPRRDVVALKERERATHEGNHGLGPLVWMKLGVGETGVVVDDRVRELIAPAGLQLGAGLVADSRHPVPGSLKARVAFGVDV